MHSPEPPAPLAPKPPAPLAKGKGTRKWLGLGATVALIIGAVLIIMALMCCVYCTYPRGKAHKSPATSDDESSMGMLPVLMNTIILLKIDHPSANMYYMSAGSGAQMREIGRRSSDRTLL